MARQAMWKLYVSDTVPFFLHSVHFNSLQGWPRFKEWKLKSHLRMRGVSKDLQTSFKTPSQWNMIDSDQVVREDYSQKVNLSSDVNDKKATHTKIWGKCFTETRNAVYKQVFCLIP